VNVELITEEGEYEGVIAKKVASQLKRAAPDIPVQLTKVSGHESLFA
jgi:hypothetical protein